MRGIEELIALVASYPRDNLEIAVDAADMAAFRGYYAKLLYEVPATCCSRALHRSGVLIIPLWRTKALHKMHIRSPDGNHACLYM